MGTLRNFMFHDVRDLKDTKYPKRYELKSFLSKDEFEYRIMQIANRYKIISSETALRLDLSMFQWKNYFTSQILYHYMLLKMNIPTI